MKKIIIALLILLMPVYSFALDKKIGSTNCMKIGVFDISSKANGIAGLNLANTSSLTGTVATNGTTTLTGTSSAFLTDFAIGDNINVSGETVRTIASITSNTLLTVTSTFSTTASGLSYNRGPRVISKIKCGLSGTVQVDTSGDTWSDESGGYYNLCTNDTITNTNEDECLEWSEGAGSYTNLIAKTPVKFKAVGATIDAVTILGSVTGTLSAGSTSTSLISTAFVATDTTDYVGWIAVTNGGTAIVKSFNPSTDTATLASSIGTVNTGDAITLIPNSLWEILYKARIIK